ncbi:MAG: hypothetical protein MRY83_17620, partial [Flavobacteriales bacterium]|nr:hypothetical protein [Flavobacteriales bacterium]
MSINKFFLFFYIQLKWKRLNRIIKERGMHPFIGLPIIIAVFLGASLLIFEKLNNGQWFYVLASWFCLIRMYSKSQKSLLKIALHPQKFRLLKMVEHFIVLVPFAIFMTFKGFHIPTVVMFLGGCFLAQIDPKMSGGFVFKTPFWRRPFEWIAGFRRFLGLLIPILAILVLSKVHNNPNLGLFGLVIMFFAFFSFYSGQEDEYFVWSFHKSSKYFLKNKALVAARHSFFSSISLVIALIIMFPSQWFAPIIVLIWGFLALTLIIFSKYSSYPNQLNLPNAILVGLSIALPPLMILTIPYYYQKSIKELSYLLN